MTLSFLPATSRDAATGDRIDDLVRNIAGHRRVKNELMIESEAIAAAER